MNKLRIKGHNIPTYVEYEPNCLMWNMRIEFLKFIVIRTMNVFLVRSVQKIAVLFNTISFELNTVVKFVRGSVFLWVVIITTLLHYNPELNTKRISQYWISKASN